MRFEQLSQDEIIFSYRMNPAFGREGDDGGFSLTLYKNGKLQYCTYILFDQINLLTWYKLEQEQVRGLYELLKRERDTLDRIPTKLDNGSKDGVIQEFTFYGHEKISALNIRETLPAKEMVFHRDYYELYRENMRYENEVLRIFKSVRRYFHKCNVNLHLHTCVIENEFALKITW